MCSNVIEMLELIGGLTKKEPSVGMKSKKDPKLPKYLSVSGKMLLYDEQTRLTGEAKHS